MEFLVSLPGSFDRVAVLLLVAVVVVLLACSAAISARAPTGVASGDCDEDEFRVIAHRGASAYAPENTLPAFRAALERGAVEVELDVQLSADDVVMLYHDKELARKTGERGTVRDHTAEQLQKMDIGRWFDEEHPEVEERFAGTPLDRLDAVFDEFGPRLCYHVELKSGDRELPRRTIAEVDRAGLRHRVRMTSFRLAQLRRSRALAPKVPHTLLIGRERKLRAALAKEVEEAEATAPPSDRSTAETLPLLDLQKREVELAASEGFDQVGIAASDLSLEIVRHAEKLGLTVRAYGIKSEADMERALDMETVGMTTDWPDRLFEAIRMRAETAEPPES